MTDTAPARISIAQSYAFLLSEGHTPAPNPYSVSLAIRTASSLVQNGATRADWTDYLFLHNVLGIVHEVNRVGLIRYPTSPTLSPPQ